MHTVNQVEEFGRLDCRGMGRQDAVNHIASAVYLYDDIAFQLMVTGDATGFKEELVKWCASAELQILRLDVINGVVHAILSNDEAADDVGAQPRARRETAELALQVEVESQTATRSQAVPARERLHTSNVLDEMVSLANELDELEAPEESAQHLMPHEDPLLHDAGSGPVDADSAPGLSERDTRPERPATVMDREGAAERLLQEELDLLGPWQARPSDRL